MVLRIQVWVKERFHKKLKDLRAKDHAEDHPFALVVNTAAQMVMASKIGMYSQMVNIGIALIDVFLSRSVYACTECRVSSEKGWRMESVYIASVYISVRH